MWGRTRLRLLLLLAGLGVLLPAADASAAAGDLDATFGGSGVVKLLPGPEEASWAQAVAVQPDGKIVVAGYEAPGNIVVLRLLDNGEPDLGFGSSGKAVTVVPTGFSEARAMTIQPDGKIVVAGSAKGAVDADFLIARYNADGSPDTGFGGGDGVALVPIGEDDFAEAVAVGADAKLVATGRAELGGKEVLATVVLLANGEPDASFDGDGVKTMETPPGDDLGVAVAALGEGKILIGDAAGAGAGDGFELVQLLASGAPDPGFGGGDGIALVPIPIGGAMGGAGRITDLALRGDGRIVASGYGYDESAGPNDLKLAVVGFLANGEPDPSFGTAGIFTQQLSPEDDQATTIDVAEGGKLLVGATYVSSVGSSPAVLRLDPEGTLDPTFGSGGLVLRGVTAPFGEYTGGAAVDSLDRLVTVGTAFGPENTSWIPVARYLGDRLPPAPTAATNRAPRTRMKKVPKKVKAAKLKRFAGTAADPDGDPLRKVQIALVRLVKGGAKAPRPEARSKRGTAKVCLVLKNARAQFKRVRPKKGRPCPRRWLAVQGKAKWRFKLKRALPSGGYVVYARAIDSHGLAESSFSRKRGNRYAFRVLRRR